MFTVLELIRKTMKEKHSKWNSTNYWSCAVVPLTGISYLLLSRYSSEGPLYILTMIFSRYLVYIIKIWLNPIFVPNFEGPVTTWSCWVMWTPPIDGSTTATPMRNLKRGRGDSGSLTFSANLSPIIYLRQVWPLMHFPPFCCSVKFLPATSSSWTRPLLTSTSQQHWNKDSVRRSFFWF